MNSGKSPGPDGLSKEFHSCFWGTIKEEMTQVLNNAYCFGNIPLSMKSAKIRLLHKKGDEKDLKNWRPISNLNTDYKIFAKIITNRLHDPLDKIIASSQKATFKSRKIQDAVANLDSAYNYAKKRNIPLSMIAIDNLKAFDRVNHQFLFNTLQSIGISKRIIQLIKSIYTGLEFYRNKRSTYRKHRH